MTRTFEPTFGTVDLADLPGGLRAAYSEFQYAPALSVNVALTNWRFLYKLNAPAVRYFNDGFGWSCNIRCPMTAGSYNPVLHPDKPIVLTFTWVCTPQAVPLPSRET